MTAPTGPHSGNRPGPQTFPATAPIVVIADACGHLPGDRHDSTCDYWRGVAAGIYQSPDAYAEVVTLPGHAADLKPLTDPALRGAA
ncbi:hypothetical protein [Micromonospora sp. NPDC051006]|uniref:hypothetical protein n=1 Tax=Micromonospora sp. NPDC051006 TaxID=3364283 RepID=UPI0037931E3D